MANFHELSCSENEYDIIDIVCPLDENNNDNEDATYRFVKVALNGSTEFNRLIVQKDDVSNYTIGNKLTLVKWTMPIIPIKIRNKRGELKPIRNVNGLSLDRASAKADSIRAAVRLYDTAEEVADSAEARKVAKEDMFFCNYVAREEFIAGLDNA